MAPTALANGTDRVKGTVRVKGPHVLVMAPNNPEIASLSPRVHLSFASSSPVSAANESQ